MTEGTVKGVEVMHVSRHGDGHRRLSHQVDHRANPAAAHVEVLTARQLPWPRDLDTREDAAALLTGPLLPPTIAPPLTPVEAA